MDQVNSSTHTLYDDVEVQLGRPGHVFDNHCVLVAFAALDTGNVQRRVAVAVVDVDVTGT